MSVYEHVAAIHAHSIYSDGSGSVEEIVAEAQAARVDVLILTDHNTLEARESGYQGWHDDLLLVVGDEVSSRAGHCIALGTSDHVSHRQSLREILEGIRSQDGHSYIAHPHGKYRPLLKQIDHGWQDWTSGAATGLELWSYMFDWASTFHYTRFLRYFRNPDAYLNGPDPETVSKWDELCQRRRVVAFGGVDAHARKYPILPWVVFPYRQLFETIRTHLITEEPLDREPDQGVAEVLTALSNGNCFLARDNLADASGTRFQTACGGLQMGDEAIYEEPIELTVALPTTAEIHLLLDGKTVQTALATSMTHTAERPGVYRVEARLDDQPWLFTNPIYLRKPSVDGKHS